MANLNQNDMAMGQPEQDAQAAAENVQNVQGQVQQGAEANAEQAPVESTAGANATMVVAAPASDSAVAPAVGVVAAPAPVLASNLAVDSVVHAPPPPPPPPLPPSVNLNANANANVNALANMQAVVTYRLFYCDRSKYHIGN